MRDDEFVWLKERIIPKAKEVNFEMTVSEFAWMITELEKYYKLERKVA